MPHTLSITQEDCHQPKALHYNFHLSVQPHTVAQPAHSLAVNQPAYKATDLSSQPAEQTGKYWEPGGNQRPGSSLTHSSSVRAFLQLN